MVAIIATTTVITTPVRRTRLVARPSLNNQPHSSQPGQGSSTIQTMHRNRHSTFNDEAAATHPRSLDLDLGPLGRRRTKSSAHRGARTAAGEGASASRGAGRREGSELLLITFAPGFTVPHAGTYDRATNPIYHPPPILPASWTTRSVSVT